MGKTYVISDIHAHLAPLKRFLQSIDDNDIVYAWGINTTYGLTVDYVDYYFRIKPVVNLTADTLVSIDENNHYVVR